VLTPAMKKFRKYLPLSPLKMLHSIYFGFLVGWSLPNACSVKMTWLSCRKILQIHLCLILTSQQKENLVFQKLRTLVFSLFLGCEGMINHPSPYPSPTLYSA